MTNHDKVAACREIAAALDRRHEFLDAISLVSAG